MARPNDAQAIAGHVAGLKAAKAAFQALPEVVRDRLNAATETTVREIARQAQANLLKSPSIDTRTLYNHVGWKMNYTNGRGSAGIKPGVTRGTGASSKIKFKGVTVNGRLLKPSRYAHLVEFGARHMKAEPFMMPAAEAEKGPHLDRYLRAGKPIEQDLAAIGARTL